MKNADERKEPMSFNVYSRQIARLQELSRQTHIPIAVLVRTAFDNFFKEFTPDYFSKMKKPRSQ